MLGCYNQLSAIIEPMLDAISISSEAAGDTGIQYTATSIGLDWEGEA